MPTLTFIYHTQSGKTERLVLAAYKAACREEGVVVRMVRAFDADAETLWSTDAVVFGTPENFGYMSGALKDFFDRTYDATHEGIGKLPYGILISAGNDGRGARREIKRIVEGYGFKLVAEPYISRGELELCDFEAAGELGRGLSAGLALGIF